MKVATKAYGLIDVDEQKFTFPQGLIGFEERREYALLDAEVEPFYWLQSLDDEQTAFLLLDPFLFRPDYETNISAKELSEIDIHSWDGSAERAIANIAKISPPPIEKISRYAQVMEKISRLDESLSLIEEKLISRDTKLSEKAVSEPSMELLTELNMNGIQQPKKALVFSIVTIPPDGSPMTANLQGPLVINHDTRVGKQVILTDTRWKTKHDIMAERDRFFERLGIEYGPNDNWRQEVIINDKKIEKVSRGYNQLQQELLDEYARFEKVIRADNQLQQELPDEYARFMEAVTEYGRSVRASQSLWKEKVPLSEQAARVFTDEFAYFIQEFCVSETLLERATELDCLHFLRFFFVCCNIEVEK